MSERGQRVEEAPYPSLEEAIECARDHVGHALCMWAQAYQTPDPDDDSGEGGQPIHRYADFKVKEALTVATLLIAMQATQGTSSAS